MNKPSASAPFSPSNIVARASSDVPLVAAEKDVTTPAPAPSSGPGLETGLETGLEKGQTSAKGEAPDRRRTVVDRRYGADRRESTAEESNYTGAERRVAVERRVDSGLERRRGPGRRLSDDRRSAEEGEMSAEQFEFVMAIQMYKKVNKRMFPTWTEVLEVVGQLGYRKIEHRNIRLENVPEPELTKVA